MKPELWRGIISKAGYIIALHRCGSEYDTGDEEKYYEFNFVDPGHIVVTQRKPKVKKWRWVYSGFNGELLVTPTVFSMEQASKINEVKGTGQLLQKLDFTEIEE